MNAAARARQAAALRGMPKDKGQGVRLGGLGVRVRNGRVIVLGQDKGPVAGACAGMVRPNPGYRPAYPQHAIVFVKFADGTRKERTTRFCDEPGAAQAAAWFNILADQAALNPKPSVPAASPRLQGMPLIQLAADCQRKAADAGKVRTETGAGKPAVKAPAKPARAMSPALQAGTAALTLAAFLLIATVISAVVDGIFLFVQHTVTYPSRCAPSIYGPPADICSRSSQVQSIVWTDGLIYGIAVVLWLVGLAAGIKQGMTKTEGSA